MVAVFPENSKNDQIYFTEINKQLQKLGTEGVRVKDGSLGGTEVTFKVASYMIHHMPVFTCLCNVYITHLMYIL